MTEDQIEARQPSLQEGDVPPPPLPSDDIRLLTEVACKRAGLETKWRKSPALDQSGEDRYSLSIAIPNGTDKRWILMSEAKAHLANSVGIRPVMALGDYEAVLYTDNFEIEAQLRGLILLGPSPISRLSRLPSVAWVKSGPPSDEQPDETDGTSSGSPGNSWSLAFIADPDQNWSASIGSSTEQFAIYRSDPSSGRFGGTASTLKIANAPVSSHDKALEFLERITGSIFFETDLRYGVPLSLSRAWPGPRRARPGWHGPREVRTEAPHLPRNSYPAKPLALYWYARSAANMPLLQYLASYQVLEYYFPTYYRREALDRLKQELLDPRFSPQNDVDLIRLLNLAIPQGKGFGGERDQLRATIRACVSVPLLEEYFKDRAKAEFFSGKTIRDVGKINVKNTSADLRDQVSDRIYDIRCRIVHAKSDSGDRYPELLLPFSEEAESLLPDIDLIQYLAQRVLIHQAQPLHS